MRYQHVKIIWSSAASSYRSSYLSYDLRLKVGSNALTFIITKSKMKLIVVGFGLAAAGTIRHDDGHDHDHDIEGKA